MTRDDLGDETRVLVERDGEQHLGAPDDAAVRVSPLDRGFLYGDAVFETLRCYDGEAAFVQRHTDRLNDALGAVGIGVRFDAAEVRQHADAVARADGDSYVRFAVTRGEREGVLAPTEDGDTVVVIGKPLGQRRYPPATVETVDEPRPVGTAARLKTHSYMPNVLAKGEAGEGTDEAVMLADGDAASGAVSNVFVVRDGAVETPPAGDGTRVRDGVTREVVLELADELGFEIRVGTVSFDAADAAFLTNTTWGVRAVEDADGCELDASHPTVERLADAYLEAASRPGAMSSSR